MLISIAWSRLYTIQPIKHVTQKVKIFGMTLIKWSEINKTNSKSLGRKDKKSLSHTRLVGQF